MEAEGAGLEGAAVWVAEPNDGEFGAVAGWLVSKGAGACWG